MPMTDDTRGGRAPGWRPLAGASLLERLRVTGCARPAADPAVAAELRALLETGGAEPVAAGAGGHLVVTKERLSRALTCPVHRTVDRFGERSFTLPLACGALVDVLFRQIVTTGSVGDPMADALDGLGVDGHQDELVAWIGDLAPSEAAELRAEVDRQSRGLADRWPTLDPAWLPRTQESMRVLLAGGAVELSARVDLAVGRPAGDRASVALVEVKSGARRPEHRDDGAFYALIESLRSPAPPFAVATYYTRTGEIDVVPVTLDLLVGAARRCLAGMRILAGTTTGPDDAGWCTECARVLPGVAVAPTAGVHPGVESVDPGGAVPAHAAPVVRLPHGRAA